MRIDLKKILCPVDFSPTSEHAIRYAVTLAESFRAELILLHVSGIPASAVCQYYALAGLEPDLSAAPPYTHTPPVDEEGGELLGEPDESQDADDDAEPSGQPAEREEDGLEGLAAALREDHGCTITTRSREGKAFLEIITTARDETVDLIVMGTHGRTGLSHVLIGSTAEKVVRMAPCPVLTVKHPEHEFVMP